MHATRLLAIAILALIPLSALRAERGGPPSEAPEYSEPLGGPDRPPAGAERPLVEQFMRELRRSNPGEFERLEALRRDDPEAFRAALREKVRARHEERMAEFRKPRGERGGNPGEGMGKRSLSDARVRPWGPRLEADPEVGPLVERYRQASTDEERGQARAELRRKAEELFAQHERHYAGRLERMEKDLAALKAEWAEYQARREDLLQRRVDAMLQGGGRRGGPPDPAVAE